ncbi:MAG: hypothetical protein DPW16_14125 [Chloroflexi bacterium]|nr:hypothetical protein [Chloroflexota bacterium]
MAVHLSAEIEMRIVGVADDPVEIVRGAAHPLVETVTPIVGVVDDPVETARVGVVHLLAEIGMQIAAAVDGPAEIVRVVAVHPLVETVTPTVVADARWVEVQPVAQSAVHRWGVVAPAVAVHPVLAAHLHRVVRRLAGQVKGRGAALHRHPVQPHQHAPVLVPRRVVRVLARPLLGPAVNPPKKHPSVLCRVLVAVKKRHLILPREAMPSLKMRVDAVLGCQP